MIFLRYIFLFFFLSFSTIGEAVDVEDFTHDFSKGFILYAEDSGTGNDITLQFGQALGESLMWDSITENFVLSDSLRVGGNIELTEKKLTFDVDNTGEGSDVSIVAEQGSDPDGEIRYNSTENQWEFSNDGGNFNPFGSGGGASLAPYIENVLTSKFAPGETKTFQIQGGNFDYNSQVEITGWEGSINSVTAFSDKDLEVNATAGATESSYSVIVKNGSLSSTLFPQDNGIDALEVMTLPDWVDLRSSGTVLSDGNEAGNDIRYKSGMSLVRDAGGMYFNGSNPWSSWAKFENLQWNRGDAKTLEWIFTRPDNTMMIGIGSTATDETSAAQYAQAEVEAYFNNSTNFWGVYGNNGTIGSAGSQSVNTSIAGGSGVYKAKFENDGGSGSDFTLYELPSSDIGDWGDESNVIATFTITGALNPDESSIMPFLIPRDGGSQRIVGVRTY